MIKHYIKHYKELKSGVNYAIPCRRKDGKEDFIVIEVRYDEEAKTDVAFINNRFMGACLEKIRPDAFWLIIK